jgi:hypothetical protein
MKWLKLALFCVYHLTNRRHYLHEVDNQRDNSAKLNYRVGCPLHEGHLYQGIIPMKRKLETYLQGFVERIWRKSS